MALSILVFDVESKEEEKKIDDNDEEQTFLS